MHSRSRGLGLDGSTSGSFAIRRELELRDLCHGPAAIHLTARRSCCKGLTLKALTNLAENMIQKVLRALKRICCMENVRGYPLHEIRRAYQ